jgi:GNAT superfamily N-acetyltransferase
MPSHDTHFDIFLSWIRGWALSREVAAPMARGDGFVIAVGAPRQAARHVFPHASPTLRELGTRVTQPWVFLKACAEGDELRALLPSQWEMQPPGFMMTCDDRPFARGPLAPGYTIEIDDALARTARAHVRVRAPDGTLAASGHVALGERRATYDRIVTEPAHQRRGLGGAVMHTLQSLAHAHGRHGGVLVATTQGRALYETLGWRLHAPWATAVIPGPDGATG